MRTIALDIETTAIAEGGVHAVQMLGYGLASERNQHSFKWSEANKQRLIDMAGAPDVMWVFHHASFDVAVLRRYGVPIREGTYHDTQIMAYCWDSSHDSYSLDNCCRRYGVSGKFDKPESWEEWTDYMAEYCVQDCVSTLNLYNKLRSLFIEDERAWKLYDTVERPYIEAIMEFERTGFLIDDDLLQRVIKHYSKKRDGLYRVLTRHTPPIPEKLEWTGKQFVPKLADIERSYQTRLEPLTGEMIQTYMEETVPIDAEVPPNKTLLKTNVKSKRLGYYGWTYTGDVPDDTSTMVGQSTRSGTVYGSHCRLQEFNPNSGQQLAYLLQFKWGWKFRKTTKTGLPKTDEEELSWILDNEHPPEMKQFIRVYLDYTWVSKLLDSFLIKFDAMKDGKHVLRGSFNQTGTCTGRLSSSEPNLQNISGGFVRRLFVAPPGWSIVGIDLSNIEGRVFAHYLKMVLDDDSMADIFISGVDFHQANADAWGVTRNDAKTLLYSILYGAGSEKVGKGDKAKGEALMATLEANAPSINILKEMVWESCAAKDGIIHDFFGRRLTYRNIVWAHALESAQEMIDADVDGKLWSHNPAKVARSLQAQAKRQVFNALLQGTAASALKILTLNVMKMRVERKLRFVMAAAVHDELQNYVPTSQAHKLAHALEEVFMEQLFPAVPIKGDAKIGLSWADTH